MACSVLGEPDNGLVNVSNVTMTLYGCRGGFLLVGEGVRLCGEDNQWTGNEPTCERITDTLKALKTTVIATLVLSSLITLTLACVIIALIVILWKYRRNRSWEDFDAPMELLQYRNAGAEYTIQPGSTNSLDLIDTSSHQHHRPSHSRPPPHTEAQFSHRKGQLHLRQGRKANHNKSSTLPLQSSSSSKLPRAYRSFSLRQEPPPPALSAECQGEKIDCHKVASSKLGSASDDEGLGNTCKSSESYGQPLLPLGTEDLVKCAESLIHKSMMSLDDIEFPQPTDSGMEAKQNEDTPLFECPPTRLHEGTTGEEHPLPVSPHHSPNKVAKYPSPSSIQVIPVPCSVQKSHTYGFSKDTGMDHEQPWLEEKLNPAHHQLGTGGRKRKDCMKLGEDEEQSTTEQQLSSSYAVCKL